MSSRGSPGDHYIVHFCQDTSISIKIHPSDFVIGCIESFPVTTNETVMGPIRRECGLTAHFLSMKISFFIILCVLSLLMNGTYVAVGNADVRRQV